MGKQIVLKPGRIGIERYLFEDGTIQRVKEDSQQSVLDAKINQGWKIITIDHQPFSEKLLIEKQEGLKDYTIELIFPPQIEMDVENGTISKVHKTSQSRLLEAFDAKV